MALWQKGESGNPGGRVKEKAFTEALRMALAETDAKGIRKLRRIADKLVDCALAGEGWAIQHVADRLEGKPMQESSVTYEKRDRSDWTRDELVAILHDAAEGHRRIAAEDLRTAESDSVH